MPDCAIHLVVGLGNPGAPYEDTRHNVGYMAVEAFLAEQEGAAHASPSPRGQKRAKAGGSFISSLFSGKKASYSKVRCEAVVHELDFEGSRIVVAKPQTFMNLSGRSVKGLLKHYGLAIDEALVVHDDLDLPAATLRIKTGGGHGGHNGLRNIIASCGEGFTRLKIGIGRPPGHMPAERFVLQQLRGEALEELKADANRAADAAADILRNGVLAAQNKYN